jgi:hypothetical protein
MPLYETPGATTKDEKTGRTPVWSSIGVCVPLGFLLLTLVTKNATPRGFYGSGVALAAMLTVGFWLGVIMSGVCGIIAIFRNEKWILLTLMDFVIPLVAFSMMITGKL